MHTAEYIFKCQQQYSRSNSVIDSIEWFLYTDNSFQQISFVLCSRDGGCTFGLFRSNLKCDPFFLTKVV